MSFSKWDGWQVTDIIKTGFNKATGASLKVVCKLLDMGEVVQQRQGLIQGITWSQGIWLVRDMMDRDFLYQALVDEELVDSGRYASSDGNHAVVFVQSRVRVDDFPWLVQETNGHDVVCLCDAYRLGCVMGLPSFSIDVYADFQVSRKVNEEMARARRTGDGTSLFDLVEKERGRNGR